jgi:hypothetical protein
LDPAERCWDAAEQRSDFALVLPASDRAADAVGTCPMSCNTDNKSRDDSLLGHAMHAMHERDQSQHCARADNVVVAKKF